MSEFTDQRLLQLQRRLAAEIGVKSELVDGPFPGSHKQLLLELPIHRHLSIMPDLDEPVLYELVLFGRHAGMRDVLRDKLTGDMVVAMVDIIRKLP